MNIPPDLALTGLFNIIGVHCKTVAQTSCKCFGILKCTKYSQIVKKIKVMLSQRNIIIFKKYFLLLTELRRCQFAFLICGMLLLLIGCFLGAAGCWYMVANLLRITGILVFFGGKCIYH